MRTSFVRVGAPALAGLLAVLALGAAGAQDGGDAGANAAEHYRKAFGVLPDTSDPQFAFLNEPDAVRLDQNVAEFVRLHDPTFAHVRAGAAVQRCDWGVDPREGAAAKLPHLESARTVANLARLRARVMFQQRRHAEALDDLAALLGLARHVGADPFVVAKLVEAGVADSAVEAASHGLANAPPEAAGRLHEAMGKLPRPIPLGDVVKAEGEAVVAQLRRMAGEEPAAPFLEGNFFWEATGGEKGDETLRAALREQWKDPAKRAAGVREVAGLFEEIASYLSLPFQNSFAGVQKWEARRQAASPLARVMVPSLREARLAVAASETRVEMLFVAAAVRAEGPKAAAKFDEPHAAGPFEYREVPGGFELESRLVVNNRPLKLVCRSSGDELPF